MADYSAIRAVRVVISGEFGRLSAANSLARAPLEVTLIDRHNYQQFPPLLYQIASVAPPPSIDALLASRFRRSVRSSQGRARLITGTSLQVKPQGGCHGRTCGTGHSTSELQTSVVLQSIEPAGRQWLGP